MYTRPRSAWCARKSALAYAGNGLAVYLFGNGHAVYLIRSYAGDLNGSVSKFIIGEQLSVVGLTGIKECIAHTVLHINFQSLRKILQIVGGKGVAVAEDMAVVVVTIYDNTTCFAQMI